MEFEKIKYKYLAKLIKNGVYKDGKKFLNIDFFKFVSNYEYGENFYEFMQNELKLYFDESDITYQTIIEFIKKNKYFVVNQISRQWVLEHPLRKFNESITNEMINKIFDYMELNGYPSINYVYSYIFYNYATNKKIIDKESSQSKKNNSDNIIRLPLMKK